MAPGSGGAARRLATIGVRRPDKERAGSDSSQPSVSRGARDSMTVARIVGAGQGSGLRRAGRGGLSAGTVRPLQFAVRRLPPVRPRADVLRRELPERGAFSGAASCSGAAPGEPRRTGRSSRSTGGVPAPSKVGRDGSGFREVDVGRDGGRGRSRRSLRVGGGRDGHGE